MLYELLTFYFKLAPLALPAVFAVSVI